MKKEDKMEMALQCYFRRKERTENPSGNFDKQGRFYPNSEELQPCCTYIRIPSKNWPYSLMVHCRSAEHIANIFGVEVKELRREIYDKNKIRREMIKEIAIRTA